MPRRGAKRLIRPDSMVRTRKTATAETRRNPRAAAALASYGWAPSPSLHLDWLGLEVTLPRKPILAILLRVRAASTHVKAKRECAGMAPTHSIPPF